MRSWLLPRTAGPARGATGARRRGTGKSRILRLGASASQRRAGVLAARRSPDETGAERHADRLEPARRPELLARPMQVHPERGGYHVDSARGLLGGAGGEDRLEDDALARRQPVERGE